MPDSLSSPPGDDASPLEVLETDSGRKTSWGVAALLAFVAFSIFVVWRVAADDNNAVSYNPSATSTQPAIGEREVSAGEAKPDRDSSAATAFFFLMVTAMVVVAVRIFFRARQLARLRRDHSPRGPGGSMPRDEISPN